MNVATPEQHNDRRLQDIITMLDGKSHVTGTVDGKKCIIAIDLVTLNFLVAYDETEVTTTFIIDQTGKILRSFAAKLTNSPRREPMTRSMVQKPVTVRVDDLLAKFETGDNNGLAIDIKEEEDERNGVMASIQRAIAKMQRS